MGNQISIKLSEQNVQKLRNPFYCPVDINIHDILPIAKTAQKMLKNNPGCFDFEEEEDQGNYLYVLNQAMVYYLAFYLEKLYKKEKIDYSNQYFAKSNVLIPEKIFSSLDKLINNKILEVKEQEVLPKEISVTTGGGKEKHVSRPLVKLSSMNSILQIKEEQQLEMLANFIDSLADIEIDIEIE